jgi:hypothetical protein
MFKGLILPSKRISSSDFTMITPLGDPCVNGKENEPDPPVLQQAAKPAKPIIKKAKSFGINHDRKKGTQQKAVQPPVETLATEQAFDKMLVSLRVRVTVSISELLQDDLQIPSTLRPKLANMDGSVKAAMVKSSQVLALNPPGTPLTQRTAQLRKTRSSDSLSSPRSVKRCTELDVPQPPQSAGLFPSHISNSVGSSPTPRNPGGHARVSSLDVSRPLSRNTVVPPFSGEHAPGKLTKDRASAVAKNISPIKFFSILSGTSSTQLDVERIKKLRLLLRNESAR